ncbi:MAG: hypothetical protein GC154_02295 [bacterium]|nr:hypothetical protein [bacterium]
MCLDRSAITRIEQVGGAELVVKMIHLFSANAPDKLNKAKEARESGDLKALSEAAHSIKSSSGNFGASDLFKKAELVERLAREQNQAEAYQELDVLERVLIQTLAALNEVLSEYQP